MGKKRGFNGDNRGVMPKRPRVYPIDLNEKPAKKAEKKVNKCSFGDSENPDRPEKQREKYQSQINKQINFVTANSFLYGKK